MDIGFQFEIIWQDSDVIELRVSGWNGLFCGAADVYVGAREREETASKLQGFPNHPADIREVVFGGFGPRHGCGGMSMNFYGGDGSGHAFVDSKIESDYGSKGKAPHAVIFHRGSSGGLIR